MKRFFRAFLSLGLLTLACSDASEVSQVELDPTDIQLVNRLIPVSYTHLTLPTNREV